MSIKIDNELVEEYMSIKIDNELVVAIKELFDAKHAANCASGIIKEQIDKWSAAPRHLATVATLLKLSYIGRRIMAEREKCKTPSLAFHMAEFADCKSCVQSYFSRWVKLALDHPHKLNEDDDWI